MRIKNLIALFAIIFLSAAPVIADNCFKLFDGVRPLKTVKCNHITNHIVTFPFQADRSPIDGLAVTGHITKFSNDYVVRIILIDKQGHEYLIMESYDAVNEQKEFYFDCYCEETALLEDVSPDSIKVSVRNAMVTINAIHYTYDSDITKDTDALKKSYNDIKREQLAIKVNQINNYNYSHNKLWRAGITLLSQKKYEDRKRILGFTDECSTDGIEFYIEGIVELGNEDCSSYFSIPRNTNFVDEFDWRMRHGKNWITPNKHQGDSGYCHFFTCIACTEALTNLYYNKLLNLDLSEQELACCSGINKPYKGVPYSITYLKKPLDYLVANGVCDEVAYPFEDDSLAICQSSEITPNEVVRVGGYKYIDNTNEDSLKKALIEHGPLVSGVHYWGNNPNGTIWRKNHAMLIVGYGQLHVGDTIYHWADSNGLINEEYVVKPGDPRVGRTYWIYKNSYGLDGDSARQGYMYFIHYNYASSMNHTCYIKPPITSMNHFDNEIVCEDNDGDGYYYWGIGDKPSWCPEWVPDIQDGDDNNYSHGKLYLDYPFEVGSLELLNPDGISTLHITGITSFNSRQSIYSHINIASNASLTVQDILNLFGRVTITIESGGELVIDGGVITNANVIILAGGKLTIKNNGKMVMRTKTDFHAPVGAFVVIEHGEIRRSHDF